jgi:hypothetical protein
VRRWALKVCKEPEKEDKTVLLSHLNLGGLIDIRKASEYMDSQACQGAWQKEGGEEHGDKRSVRSVNRAGPRHR